MNNLPFVSKQEIDSAGGNASDLINLLTTRYRELIASDVTGQMQNSFTPEQHILIAYQMFDGQVMAGGFLQLIENGFGAYIFDTPFGEYLKNWGLIRSSSLINQARVLYSAKKETLEREKSLEEFARMYQEHPEFEPLDNEYYAIADAEREILLQYILSNINRLATIS